MIRRRRFRFYAGQLKDIVRLSCSGKIADGEYRDLFEERFARYIGKRFAVSTCSGRYGLEIILEAFRLQPGDEVILPAYTLEALPRLIAAKGLVPRLADISPRSFNMDPDSVERQITSKTRAIVATHLFGVPCDIETISQLARRHGLLVIEDCAHALGSRFKGRRTGSFGDAAFFSFETLKLINTFGGGMVVTDDPAVATAARAAARKPADGAKVLGRVAFGYLEHMLILSPLYPVLLRLLLSGAASGLITRLYLLTHRAARISGSGLSNLQALMGLRQLETLDERNRLRAGRAAMLQALLDPRIRMQESGPGAERVHYFLVARVPVRGDLEPVRRSLALRGVDTGIKAEITDDCSRLAGREEDCPMTREAFAANLQLPISDDLTDEELAKVAAVLKDCFR